MRGYNGPLREDGKMRLCLLGILSILLATPAPNIAGSLADATPAASPEIQSGAPLLEVDDKRRSYSKEQLIATIHGDARYKNPLRLTALLPLVDSNFLVTHHQGDQRPDRLALWKKVEENSYQLLDVIYADPASSETFLSPVLIEVEKQAPPPRLSLLYIVKTEKHGFVEIPYVIDTDQMQLTPATIESPLKEDGQATATPPPPQNPGGAHVDIRLFPGVWTGTPESIAYGVVKIRSGTYQLRRYQKAEDDGTFQFAWKLVPTTSTAMPGPPKSLQ